MVIFALRNDGEKGEFLLGGHVSRKSEMSTAEKTVSKAWTVEQRGKPETSQSSGLGGMYIYRWV